ncbi:MAG: hypothetical protein JSW44_00885 [Candidatus Bathyarchaeota archaeon]|nr:MAG: hypothetical protein JSW44_00885 [Candidatus Bathyarchaeota archaeon]
MDWLEYLLPKILRLLRRLPLNRILFLGRSTRSFADYFKDFGKLEAVRGIFGERTEEVLQNLKVDLTWFGGYMYVDSSNGHLVISAPYLNSGDKVDIYLDVIHELCHVRQFMEGKALFDSRYSYVERPTEVEAYRYTIQEAKRIGLSDERICEYLRTEWMSYGDLKRLAKAVNVTCQ